MKKLIFTVVSIFAFAFLAKAQNVAINADGSNPDASAILDVKSTSAGLLIPRVALTGSDDVATISSPSTSLLVYNTATVNTVGIEVAPGFYFWDGSEWTALNLDKDWVLSADETEMYANTNSEHVGIGETNPGSKLHLYDDRTVDEEMSTLHVVADQTDGPDNTWKYITGAKIESKNSETAANAFLKGLDISVSDPYGNNGTTAAADAYGIISSVSFSSTTYGYYSDLQVEGNDAYGFYINADPTPTDELWGGYINIESYGIHEDRGKNSTPKAYGLQINVNTDKNLDFRQTTTHNYGIFMDNINGAANNYGLNITVDYNDPDNNNTFAANNYGAVFNATGATEKNIAGKFVANGDSDLDGDAVNWAIYATNTDNEANLISGDHGMYLEGDLWINKIKTVGTPYSLADDDFYIYTSGSGTITVPSATGRKGKIFIIKAIVGGTPTLSSGNNMYIDGAAGATSHVMPQYGMIRLISDGNNWFAF